MLIIQALSYAMFAVVYGIVLAIWLYIVYKSVINIYNAVACHAEVKIIDHNVIDENGAGRLRH